MASTKLRKRGESSLTEKKFSRRIKTSYDDRKIFPKL